MVSEDCYSEAAQHGYLHASLTGQIAITKPSAQSFEVRSGALTYAVLFRVVTARYTVEWSPIPDEELQSGARQVRAGRNRT